jgi:hypothetical protein
MLGRRPTADVVTTDILSIINAEITLHEKKTIANDIMHAFKKKLEFLRTFICHCDLDIFLVLKRLF